MVTDLYDRLSFTLFFVTANRTEAAIFVIVLGPSISYQNHTIANLFPHVALRGRSVANKVKLLSFEASFPFLGNR